ncbi:Outer membrane protein OprM [Paraburkholderia domus]|jgi:efflux transporter, outer membrane factor (OMF) lipoprotein, NodT family|uniref:Outer membrane protein OprM n=1 Tax=Paraburkholderia domus TaxID=2793075 RepID=A0A9N8N3D4_9BURK|nr:efflux transporter outer membrane subunit [Paraburkholderia domus]CAE6803497.1 Outer membrane protein OprM [Paraburkholderia domus]CAE6893444.1 Outer membrane protein OprM [Paraburkholderia domus]CAE6937962.1 Outer membrane protein OprM [Paraburkholderia domus]CAE6947411.1 Outer membrane protein OprM [Paraburkholderia domus]CAE6949878.1 Outer membrane protein OprM [Paraburkholderia domus]
MSSLIQTCGNALESRILRRSALRGVMPAVLPGMMAAVVLGACAVGPDFNRPAPPTVLAYTHEPLAKVTVTADSETQRFTPGAAVPFDWWRLFGSAQLDASVDEALAHNPTLEASEASLRESQDSLRAGYGVFFPQIGAQVDGVRERTAPQSAGSAGQGTIFNLITASGTISYALDVFGGKRRTVEGLQAQADYQRYLTKAAYLTLSANVVNTTIAQAGYAAEIRATEQLIGLEKQQLEITEAQVRAGTSAYASVLSVRSLIAANQASLAPLRQKISEADHLLATLEGAFPSEANLPEIELSSLSLPKDLPVSLPSELVRQRPDILSAEAQLHVASANIGVATAAMFPSISLNGTYGAGGTSFGNLSTDSFRFWSIGPSITIPLFQGGSLWYGRKAAIDAYQQSQANYRQTVLAAFAQVADALKALEYDAQALEAQAEAQRDAVGALSLLQASYRAGTVGYLDVLVADVQLHQATIAYLEAVAQRHQDTVALFVALGGGWWNGQEQASGGQ